MDMAQKVYEITKSFPRDEIYGITQQIRRSVVSIPSNIAEGQGRNGRKEFVHFLGISRGSLAELQTQLMLSKRLRYIPDQKAEDLLIQSEEVSKLINGLLKSLTDH